jgi:hypothetical protein
MAVRLGGPKWDANGFHPILSQEDIDIDFDRFEAALGTVIDD